MPFHFLEHVLLHNYNPIQLSGIGFCVECDLGVETLFIVVYMDILSAQSHLSTMPSLRPCSAVEDRALT